VASVQTVRVAAIQATPVVLDGGLCREGGRSDRLGRAGKAQLAVLPEAFVPLYPSNAWARQSAAFSGGCQGAWGACVEHARSKRDGRPCHGPSRDG
jgi:predicted amidohydrolase